MSLVIDIDRLALGVRVLAQGVRIEVPAGAIHTVMGASGSGKSSLLAAVCGTLSPEFSWSGRVQLDGAAIDALPTHLRRIGLLFQDDLLFAHMTVRENLLFAVPAGPRAEREAVVQQALADLELPG